MMQEVVVQSNFGEALSGLLQTVSLVVIAIAAIIAVIRGVRI